MMETMQRQRDADLRSLLDSRTDRRAETGAGYQHREHEHHRQKGGHSSQKGRRYKHAKVDERVQRERVREWTDGEDNNARRDHSAVSVQPMTPWQPQFAWIAGSRMDANNPPQTEPPIERSVDRPPLMDRLRSVFKDLMYQEQIVLCGKEAASALRRSLTWSPCQIRLGTLEALAHELPLCTMTHGVKLLVISGGEIELEAGMKLGAILQKADTVLELVGQRWPWLPILLIPPIRIGVLDPVAVRQHYIQLARSRRVRVAADKDAYGKDVYAALANPYNWTGSDRRQLSPDGRRNLSYVIRVHYDEVVGENRASALPRGANRGRGCGESWR